MRAEKLEKKRKVRKVWLHFDAILQISDRSLNTLVSKNHEMNRNASFCTTSGESRPFTEYVGEQESRNEQKCFILHHFCEIQIVH